jgi:DNA-damage-inducible protein J
MATARVTVYMDSEVKEKAEALFEEMGMSITTAFTVFTRAALRHGKIPFEVAAGPVQNAKAAWDEPAAELPGE